VSTALASAPPADATRLLYEQHSSRIFGFCLSRLGSREEAEDAVQTTFLNAQRGLRRGVVPEYEVAWLFKIAQNVCHNRHQSARRRGRVEAAQDLDALQDVLATPERGSAVSLGDLTQALSAVPERQRRALLLREFQGLSYEEIGVELGVSVAAVETLIFRARRSVAAEVARLDVAPRTRRGAVASIVELGRWFFQGGAAPVKLAAVAATVATTAALTVMPAAHKPATTPPTGPTSVTPTKVEPTVKAPRAAMHSTVRPTPARPAAPTGSTASLTSPPPLHSGSTAVPTDPQSAPLVVVPAAGMNAPTLPLVPAFVVSAPALPAPGVDLVVPPSAISLPDLPVTVPPVLPKLP
jgi:RNA polymerase sigma-70 factor (ECF subfamily)